MSQMLQRVWPVLLVGAVVVFLFLYGARLSQNTKKSIETLTSGGFTVDGQTPGYENFTKLIQGCPFKDCIPSIDNPQFETTSSADSWLKPDDVVFGFNYKGVKRAYPQRILNWHEIVNDEINRDPLAITFCPLCGSALAFDRRVNGQILEFGVSGKLHNNDLVMYDRETQSLWQQITGEAIVGVHFGKRLTQISIDTLRWKDWKAKYPQTHVLSRETGFDRDYELYPYGDYEQSNTALFPVQDGIDRTIHPKSVVYGIEINGAFKAYPIEKVKSHKSQVKDKIGKVEVEFVYGGGEFRVRRIDTGEDIVPTRLFWFAWKVFHPTTELY